MRIDSVKFGIYIHIPFCQKRCSYCDFNTYAGRLKILPAYIDGLCLEIEKVMRDCQKQIHVQTIYLGGGTPSLVEQNDLAKVVASLNENFQFEKNLEFSIEVNPGTVSRKALFEIRNMGVNRLSIGMQSAQESELKLLGRIHSFVDVIHAVQWARECGFDNINLDLIYGLPNQTINDWEYNLDKAIDLKPEHLSLYALTLEPEVPMYRWIETGRLPVQDDDLMADMYEFASQRLEAAGFVQYEISNWAKRGKNGQLLAGQHNLQYWRNLPYLGFGAGAHGFAENVRTENLLRINAYIQRCQQKSTGVFPRGPALKSATPIDTRREMQETMMLGLRLMEGVSRELFQKRFAQDMVSVFGSELDLLLRAGLVEWDGENCDNVRLTRQGRFVSNQVFRQFVD